MKVALRADASPALGTGHVRRCLALAHALREAGADVRLATRSLGFDTAALARAAGFPTVVVDAAGRAGLSARADHVDDAHATAAALAADPPHWIVVDHYGLGARWHTAVARALGCRVAVIDDLADRELRCDLLVDHNHCADHRAKYAGRLDAGTPLLGGPRYALLGPAYADAPRCEIHDEVRSLGIFMGGLDAAGASTLVLRAIGDAGFDGPVEVVSSAASPGLDTLRAAAAARPHTTLRLDLPELSAFFARHDVQVGAGGGATWERCCIGAPTLALVVADNQRVVVPELAAIGVVAAPQPEDALDCAAVARALRALIGNASTRRSLAERARALVDGHGARRVALRLLADTLTLRRATPADAKRLHDWRNHPATRGMSRDSAPIPWPVHTAWLERTLADPTRTLLVGSVGRIPVGVIRFDGLGSGTAEVSLYLDPLLHGLGLGSALLRAGEVQVPPDHDLAARVLDANPGSQRLFAAAGYVPQGAGRWLKPAAPRLPQRNTA